MPEDRQKYWESLIATANSSPYYQLIGMRITAIGEGEAYLAMPVETKLHHSRGIVQGGAIASIADAAAAFAVFSLVNPGEAVNTIEIKLNYLRPVSQGELTAEGRVVHKGKRIAVVDMEVKQDGGKMVAKGMATMMIL